MRSNRHSTAMPAMAARIRQGQSDHLTGEGLHPSSFYPDTRPRVPGTVSNRSVPGSTLGTAGISYPGTQIPLHSWLPFRLVEPLSGVLKVMGGKA